MDKERIESALVHYAEALIKERGQEPKYDGRWSMIAGGGVSVWRPNQESVELVVGNLRFRYHFSLTDELKYDFSYRLDVSIYDFDKCHETGELGNIGIIRNKLKEIEKQAEDEDKKAYC